MDHFEVTVPDGMPPDLMTAALEEHEIDAELAVEPGIDVPFTPVAQRVLDRCKDFADLIGGKAVLTEHLLLAISSTPECAAAKLIQEHRGSSESLLSALQFVLGAAGPPPPEHLPSPRLGRVIVRAKREAYRQNHSEVSTLHLLMGLIKERQGPACFALDLPTGGLQKLAVANINAVRSGESDE